MTKRQLLDFIEKELKDIPDDAVITLGDDYPIRHTYELKPSFVCGKGMAWMPYFCVREPGHEGKCYCSCKNVEFTPETPEEIQALYDSIK